MGLISRVSSRTYRLKMQIFLQDQEIHTVEVTPETLVGDLVEFEGSRLQFAGETLDEEKTLGDYLIEEEATIQIIHPVLGGGRKRKKKVYTTPKKIKHKRKKVKLATLKYYKIDGDGKIERLRRECPNETCGAGIFMAAMHNRQYCGRCHLTSVFDDPK